MMKKNLLLLFVLMLTSLTAICTPIDLYSPDKRIKVSVDLKNKIFYSVNFNGDALMKDSWLQLNLDDQKLGSDPKLVKKTFSTISNRSHPIVPLNNSIV